MWIEALVTKEQLRLKDAEFKAQYLDLFPLGIPDVMELPDNVLMNIKLKDDLKPMVAQENTVKAGKSLFNNILLQAKFVHLTVIMCPQPSLYPNQILWFSPYG